METVVLTFLKNEKKNEKKSTLAGPEKMSFRLVLVEN